MKKIFTVGVFDFLHLGHILLFKRAKRYGDYLIVAVQKDVFKYKPNAKVVYNIRQRKDMVASVKYVDEVVTYSDVDKIIKKIDFDIFVKGLDQNHDGFKRATEYCRKTGKEIITLSRTKGVSSTKLRNLISKDLSS